jgi:subtilisin family serine protease
MSDIIAGVDWVSRRAIKPAVANMSLAGGASSALDDAVRASISSGIVYVVAAGNYGADACNYSPARVQEAITVGSTDQRDFRDPISNYGSCVDLFAPGVLITSTWNQTSLPFTQISGTSTAAPHVAGVAAQYLQAHPSAKPAEVESSIVTNATQDVVFDIGIGSPNRFLYSVLQTTGGEPSCDGSIYGGNLPGTGSAQYQSSVYGYTGRSGQYVGSLSAQTGTQFRFSLEAKRSSRWSTVAVSSNTGSGETLSYRGKSGTYRWRIESVSGSGDYSLCAVNP